MPERGRIILDNALIGAMFNEKYLVLQVFDMMIIFIAINVFFIKIMYLEPTSEIMRGLIQRHTKNVKKRPCCLSLNNEKFSTNTGSAYTLYIFPLRQRCQTYFKFFERKKLLQCSFRQLAFIKKERITTDSSYIKIIKFIKSNIF